MAYFRKPFQKEIRYFCGYRILVLSDALSELPMVEETRRTNMIENQVIIPQFKLAEDRFVFNAYTAFAD